MHVRDLMSSHPFYCSIAGFASDAARAMWEHDIGCVPVVDEDHRPVGMVTDRDVCMGAYTRDQPPSAIPIRAVMSSGVFTCKASDSLASAEQTMRDWQVRRLPVIDDNDKLIGVLSLNDIVLASARSGIAKAAQRLRGDVQHTLAAVCRHRELPVGP